MSLFTLGARLTADAKRLAATIKIPRREALREIRMLAAHALNLTPAQLVVRERESPGRYDLSPYGIVFDRRLKGEPIAYIIGECGFYEHAFRVTPGVLIPRPETELLVESALQSLPEDSDASILDLGTGSGCVGISIALARQHAVIVAADSSTDALTVAQENALLLGAKNIRFVDSDWYAALGDEKFHVIVSNPPYVSEGDPHLADLSFEPTAALVGGPEGMDALETVISQASGHLVSGGLLAVEHGRDQQEKVIKLFENSGFENVRGSPDLSGHPRLVTGRWAENSSARPKRRKAAVSA
ncbi:MAG: peptide chain release factor N(5)-glutamine methyltransferase [Betaproteobacteria bacterium]|nr:peptide chain release factor N(5)-glutamine methyltransferase [Betaproteobacteria bacterium]